MHHAYKTLVVHLHPAEPILFQHYLTLFHTKYNMMKTMNTRKPALATNIKTFLGSILLSSTILSTNCLAKIPIQQAVNEEVATLPVEVAQLEKFTGYYQLPTNSDFILFEVKDNILFAKKLWDNKKYHLSQVNESTFEAKDGGYKVEFIKDNSGHYAYAKILGKIMSVKVNFNPEKITQLSTEQFKQLEGTYISKGDNNFTINIRASNNGVILKQLWDDKEIEFTPRSETFFLNQDRTFPLTFSLNNKEAVQVTCFENEVWIKEK